MVLRLVRRQLVLRCAAWLAVITAAAPFSLAAIEPQSLLHEAKRLCYRIKSAQSRAAALAELAVRHDAIGSGEADRLWQLSQECATAVDDPLARLLAHRAVLARMLRVDFRRQQAEQLARDLIAAAAKLSVAVDQSLALRELGATVAQDFPALAKSALSAAVDAASKIPEPLVRASALAETAQIIYQLGDRDTAAQVAEKAYDAWLGAEPSLERDLTGVEVVRALALTNAEKARQVAGAIEEVQVKARALTALGRAIAAADIGQALLAVRAIADPTLRALAMAGVACRLAATQPDLAARLARDALHASEQVPDAMRDLIVSAAASALAPTDTSATLRLIAKIKNDDVRAEAAAAAAKLLAPHDPVAAVNLLQSVDAPEVIEPAWPEVLYWYAKKNPDDAYKIAGEILERYLRVRALLRIWDAIAGIKQNKTGELGAKENQ